MESDRTQRRKSSFLKGNFVPARHASRNARHEQSWNASDFSMNGKSCARTGDALPGLQIDNAFADSDHRPRAAVARTLRLVETAAHRLNRRKDSVSLHFTDDLPH